MWFKWFFLMVWLGFSFHTSAKEKPNIILIMVDDMGWGDLGCYGQQMIRTPHIDAFAANGMRFTNYYAGNTVCAPSRETLLTGMHTGHTFIRGNFLTDEQEDPALPENRVTIAEQLKQVGYYTGLIGKWGLGGEKYGPEKQGFDYSYGYLDQIQAHNYYPPFLYENGKKVVLEQNSSDKKRAYSHHLFVDKTFGFLDNRPKERPFFLYLPYTIPHGKHVIPDASVYADKDWPEQFKNYAAMISLLDSDIGRLLDRLKGMGLDKNTLIFFTSDNGANVGISKFFNSNGPFRGAKTNLYEGGIRVPLIASWPGHIRTGIVNNRVIAAWDFMPTLLEFAGATARSTIDGLSFYPTLMGIGRQSSHEYLYWEYYTYNYGWNKPDAVAPRNWLDSRAVRFGKWKAIVKNTATDQKGTMQLFNLETDKSESKDLSAAYPGLVKQIWNIMAEASTTDVPYFPYKN